MLGRPGPALCSLSFLSGTFVHAGVRALGVGPGLGTRESDNSQACLRSLRSWALGGALPKRVGPKCRPP